MIRKDLFLSLGGFDPRYAPAYFEDVNLCMAIREAGLRVVYQPRACVFHIEHASSGPDRAMELQLRNCTKFRAKWRHQLRRYPVQCPEEEWFARDVREGRRVLFADDRVPSAGQGSGYGRSRAMLESLASLGYIVTFVPLVNVSAHEPAASELQQQGVEVLHSVENIRERLSQRVNLYDVIIVSRPHNAHWIQVIKEFNSTATVIYDAEAVYSLRDALRSQVEGDPVSRSMSNQRLLKELSISDEADAVISVNERERALFLKHNPDIKVLVWGASISTRKASPSFDGRSDFLFLGSLATPPNADALGLILQAIFPALRRSSNARLTVVGGNPSALAMAAAAALESVVLTGYVDDATPFFDKARVFLAPHRFAAGVPSKVIESMAMGVPCVLSPLLAQQLNVTDGVEALVGDGVNDFCLKALRLYEDKELWLRIQKNALHLIGNQFEPVRMRDALWDFIERVVGDRFGQSPRDFPCSRIPSRDIQGWTVLERPGCAMSADRRGLADSVLTEHPPH